jgi:catechol 2,3-dioxygenase-like lactoylglutathione lyase family enzyme
VRIGATLRLELFVDDLAASLDFYRRVLGFRPGPSQPGGYTPLEKGSVDLALNLRSDLPDGHPIRIGASERPGLGVESVLEVDDVAATCQHVAAQQWLSLARTWPWAQVLDLLILSLPQSRPDDHHAALPASNPSLSIRRPPPARPREPRLASPSRRVQANGKPAQAAHDGSFVLGWADQGLGRVETIPRVRHSRHGPALAAAPFP